MNCLLGRLGVPSARQVAAAVAAAAILTVADINSMMCHNGRVSAEHEHVVEHGGLFNTCELHTHNMVHGSSAKGSEGCRVGSSNLNTGGDAITLEAGQDDKDRTEGRYFGSSRADSRVASREGRCKQK